MSMVTIFSENKGSPFLKKWSVQMGIACWKEGRGHFLVNIQKGNLFF